MSLPPGPRAPAALQLAQWVFRPMAFMSACARRHGDMFTVRFPGYPPMVFLSDPEAVREVFRGDPEVYLAGRANRILEPLLGPGSLLLLDAGRHRKERRLLLPPFHGERMRAYGLAMRTVTDEAIDAWPVGVPFPLRRETEAITLEIILRTVFGVDDEATRGALRPRVRELLGISANPLVAFLLGGRRAGGLRFTRPMRLLGRRSPVHVFQRRKAAVDEFLFREMQARRAGGTPGGEDIFSLLLRARYEDGDPLSDSDLRDEMVTLLFAGHETTASALAWVFGRLAGDPGLADRLRAEVRAATGAGPVEPDQVRELRLVDAVIRETLRLHPIVPIVARELSSDVEIGGWRLPAGCVVAPAIWLVHRRPDLWRDPERFDPERFLGRNPGAAHYFPFGGGVRTCLGMSFAYYEMAIVVARALTRVDLRLAPGYRPRMKRRGILFAPSRDLPVVVRGKR